MNMLPFASLMFVVGYVYREIGAFKYTHVTVYIVSLCLTYGSPPIYEFANYVILGRILYYVPYYSPIHPGRVITTFGFLSSVIEALNANGASRLANVNLTHAQQNIGHNLLRAGLAIQLFVILCFVAIAVYFQQKCKKNGVMPQNLRSVLTTLYISTALISTRTIYRTVEYFSTEQIHVTPGFDPMSIKPIIRYEWYFWVFEATIMGVNTLLLNFRHPAMYLPRSNKVYLAEDGVTEIEGPGFEDKRNFVLTIFDPCDLIGLVRGRDKKERYWENHENVFPSQEATDTAVSTAVEVEAKAQPRVTPWKLFKRAFLADRKRHVALMQPGGQSLENADIEKTGVRLKDPMKYLRPNRTEPAATSTSTSEVAPAKTT